VPETPPTYDSTYPPFDLLSAIVARARETQSLTEWLGDRIFDGSADGSPDGPYAVVDYTTQQNRRGPDSCSTYTRTSTLEVTIWGYSPAHARSIGVRWASAFSPQSGPISFSTGATIRLECGPVENATIRPVADFLSSGRRMVPARLEMTALTQHSS
jgi:hypothetical protein